MELTRFVPLETSRGTIYVNPAMVVALYPLRDNKTFLKLVNDRRQPVGILAAAQGAGDEGEYIAMNIEDVVMVLRQE